jgi:hypothetical protein
VNAALERDLDSWGWTTSLEPDVRKRGSGRDWGTVEEEALYAFARGARSFLVKNTFSAGVEAQMIARWASMSVQAWW